MIYTLFLDIPILEKLAFALAYAIALIISFSLHEFSHAFAAYKVGDPTAKQMGRMSLNPFKHIDPLGMLCFFIFGFGWAKPVQTNPLLYKNYRKGKAIVSLAGITANLILAFLFSGIYYACFVYGTEIFVSSNLFMIFLSYFIQYMVILNISLFAFNLIPICPLDGFNFITAFMKPMNKFIEFMYKYGSIILLLFLITPLFDFVFDFVTNGVIDILFSFWGLIL